MKDELVVMAVVGVLLLVAALAGVVNVSLDRAATIRAQTDEITWLRYRVNEQRLLLDKCPNVVEQ